MTRADTGESTASIRRRCDDEAQPRALGAMRLGATLHRPSKLQTYHAHDGANYVDGTGLSGARVRVLEAEGVITHIGIDRYGLSNGTGQ